MGFRQTRRKLNAGLRGRKRKDVQAGLVRNEYPERTCGEEVVVPVAVQSGARGMEKDRGGSERAD